MYEAVVGPESKGCDSVAAPTFYVCEHCGNVVEMLYPSGVSVVCCGEPMTELVANTVDAAHEKHVPVVTVEGYTVTVRVGEVDHPMVPEHYIVFIALETDQGIYRKALKPGDEPVASFCIAGETFVAAYEYCNLHGLWKA